MEQLNGAVQPPIEYPTFAVLGKEYSLKFGLGASYRLERLGFNPSNLKQEILDWQKAGKNIGLVLTLGSAMLGTQQGEQFVALGFSPEQLADTIPQDSIEPLAKAIIACMVKAQPAGMMTSAQTQSADPSQPKPS